MTYPIIGNLNPRTHGRINNWHEQLDGLARIGCTHIWINPDREETELAVPDKGKGSIYAVKNYGKLSRSFSDLAPHERRRLKPHEIDIFDKGSVNKFVIAAHEKGMGVMADLVFTIVARDNGEVRKEEEFLHGLTLGVGGKHILNTAWREEELNERHRGGELDGQRKKLTVLDTITYHDEKEKKDVVYHVRFKRTQEFNKPPGNTALYIGGAPEPWPDVAFINYGDPKQNDPASCKVADYFIDTLWRPHIKNYLELGYKGFRCDVAYEVPPYVWQKLIEETRASGRYRDTMWVAETLGQDINHKIERLAKAQITDKRGKRSPAFDYVMNSASWLQERNGAPLPSDSWYFSQGALLKKASRHGTVGFVDSHDHEPFAGKLIHEMALATRNGATSLPPDEAIEYLGTDARKRLADAVFARCKQVATLSDGVIIVNGTQFCCPYQPSVFKDKDTENWDKWMRMVRKYPELDISDRLAQLHAQIQTREAQTQAGAVRA